MEHLVQEWQETAVLVQLGLATALHTLAVELVELNPAGLTAQVAQAAAVIAVLREQQIVAAAAVDIQVPQELSVQVDQALSFSNIRMHTQSQLARA